MTPGTGRVLAEAPVAGDVPRAELAEWARDLGVRAGITLRGEGPAPGFDLGLWTGEPVGEVMRRWRAFRRALGVRGLVLGTQVHGPEVRWQGAALDGWLQVDGVDGHATDRRGLALAVTVADCIPVYLASPAHGVIALLHAGWRGAAAGILPRALGLLAESAGVVPGTIHVHLGVGICGDCYEVGAEVRQAFGQPAEGNGPWHMDLRSALAAQAEGAGVATVSRSPWCSAHDRGRFYSHRASGGRDGRMVAYLAMPEELGDVTSH